MLGRYLQRGVLAGTMAGTVLAGYLAFTLWLPAHQGETHHSMTHAAIDTGVTIGVGSAIAWGLVLGLTFSFFYFVFEHSLPGSSRHRPYVLALCGFITVSAFPWLLLPPTTESIVQPLDATTRVGLYSLGMLGGAAATSSTVVLYHRSADWSVTYRLLVCLTPGTLLVTTALLLHQLILPVVFSTAALSRVALVGVGQLLVWLLIATGFRVCRRFTSSIAYPLHG